MSRRTNQLISQLETEIDEFERRIEYLEESTDERYDDGYREGVDDGYAEARECFVNPASLLARARTEKQPHGWLTTDGNIFGFGDTAEESLVNYLKNVARAL